MYKWSYIISVNLKYKETQKKNVMEKHVKLFLVFMLGLVFTFGVTSCSDDDGYSLGKFWVNWATVNEVEGNRYFILDDSTTLFVAASSTGYQPKNKRVIINYTILSDKYGNYDHAIKLNGYYADVLTKNVLYIDPADQVKQDSIGNDPIKLYSVWEGGGYLNFHFGYNTGNQDAHMINLISSNPDLSVADDIVNLDFRHNRKNDPENYWVEGYASFDLAPYRKSGRESVKFNIKVQVSNTETKTYEVEYKYGALASEN